MFNLITGEQKLALALSVMSHAVFLTIGTPHLMNAFNTVSKEAVSIQLEFNTFQAPVSIKTPLPSKEQPQPKLEADERTQEASKPEVKEDYQKIKEEIRVKQEALEKKINAIRAQLNQAIQNQPAPAEPEYGVVSIKNAGRVWDQYLEKIRRRVIQSWHPMVIENEENLEPSEVRLDFIVDPTGQVLSYGIVESKGSSAFKVIALKSFQSALPFEPPPVEEIKQNKKKSYAISFYFYYR
ncbi:MAG: hypothetical protein COV74_05280 [Candidatus Omnitrophica bacterium CG11_big_fil_rev_8_21_14_0_20_45_26]|uniref:TonB C-terminal domain-containing protein n=1 Tax=Candidatus Abzuiibacterium crystallinum TaxID=1974748 RepID=A0A2H0LPI7_9BACT|nr:MAG: hypothetical protein COV74_05280 [Candidatus Omnitrophica bacterium CG11_big_fil_rev_8_21_14_0_20_45_26]PIW64303.1 MAG: hypothetical protein COW12_06600 [Candidatus Omnitrophica bacterium CG12_big_fil_rev_8_21_14_0_65_45_16]